MLITSLLVMGIATVLIGCLPTYAQVGVLAPILLVTVRVIQGLAFGAEWGGAILMTFEHAPWKKKGQYTAIPQAGFPLGLLLANLAFLASSALPGDWAWRVPFLLSSVLILAGLYIRLKVEESPEFELAKEEGELVKNPLFSVIKNDWRNLLRAFGLRVAETAGYAVAITYVTSYLRSNELASRPDTILAIVIAAAVRLPGHLVVGPIDRPDRAQAGLPVRHHRHRPVRHADVPAAQHRAPAVDRRRLHRRVHPLPELPRRDPRGLVR